jgi:hypothetical protein
MRITRAHFFSFAILAGLATAIAIQHQIYSQHRMENLALRQQAAQLDELRAANQPPVQSEVISTATPAPSEAQLQELQRLRAEVGGLKQQLAETADASNKLHAARQQAIAASATQMEAFKSFFESKQQLLEQSVPAFMAYVEQNHGQFPASFEQARPFLPAEAQAGLSVLAQNFELTFQGSLTNLSDPASVIAMRQKEPLQTPTKGAWLKAYIFADGHSDVHIAPDGNFAPWEQQHSPRPAGQSIGR